MLRSCFRAGKPARRLTTVQSRGLHKQDPYWRTPGFFNVTPTLKTDPSSHRLSDTVGISLQTGTLQKRGSETLKQVLEICAATGPTSVPSIYYAQLLENLLAELRAMSISKARDYNLTRLRALESLLDSVPNLESRHYSALISIAHLTGRPKQVEHAWEQALLSGCDKTSLLLNSYLRAKTDSVPRFRNDSQTPDLAKMEFWSPNKVFTNPEDKTYIDPLKFVEEMREMGVEPTRTTYTLAISHYARQGNLPLAVEICENIWGVDFTSGKLEGTLVPPTSEFSPSLSTLTTIVDAFGVNDRLVEGKAFAETIAQVYNIRLDVARASSYWTMIMRHALYTAIPYGQSPRDMCNSVWSKIVEYGFSPSASQYSLRIRDLLMRERLDDAQAIMHYALGVDSDGRMASLIKTYLRPLLRRYASTGDYPKAIAIAQSFQNEPRLENFISLQLNELELAKDSFKTPAKSVEGEAFVEELHESLVEELRYIPEDEEDEESFLQL